MSKSAEITKLAAVSRFITLLPQSFAAADIGERNKEENDCQSNKN